MLVSSLIKASLRAIGAIESGVEASADEYADGLESLNSLLTNLSDDGIIIPSRTVDQLAIGVSQASYSIGSGGEFDTELPLWIEHAFIRLDGIDYSIDISDAVQYKDISNKFITGAPPRFLYYEPSHPLGRIYFNVIPLTTHTLHLTSMKPLSEFAAITDEIGLPKSYERFLRWNLAVELAPEYGQSNVQLVMKLAEDSRDSVERKAFKSRATGQVIDHGVLPYTRGQYDITRGPG